MQSPGLLQPGACSRTDHAASRQPVRAGAASADPGQELRAMVVVILLLRIIIIILIIILIIIFIILIIIIIIIIIIYTNININTGFAVLAV